MNEETKSTETTLTSQQSTGPAYQRLRVWPPILLVVAMFVARWIPSLWENGPENVWMFSAFGPAVCGIAILLWWLLISRATIKERLVGFFGCIAAMALTTLVLDKSMYGPAMLVLTFPTGMALFGLSAGFLARRLNFSRTLISLLIGLLGFGFSALLRSDGMWGDFAMGLDWRWSETAEQQLVASKTNEDRVALGDVTNELELQLANPEWPCFRGVDRTSRLRGVQLATDWETNKPEKLWQIAVGPGWSSFTVAGNLLFTQEQRGPMECVVCYAADSGKEVWACEIESRFEEAIGGPGPRATPTLSGGQLYAMGAEGFLLRIQPASGDVVWKKDIREIAERDPPIWGFSSSPLVVDGNVIVHAGGAGDKGILAFDTNSGDSVWSTTSGDHSYCSPQLSTIGNQQYVLITTNRGLNVIDPSSGQSVLDYEWKHGGYRTVQPQVYDADSILIPSGMGSGTRRIQVSLTDGKLTAKEVWTSMHMKPDFNDLVIYGDHAYGFDNSIFACINLETGRREWKGGRYGKGQVLLIEDSGLLLVATEKGQVVLLEADPTKRKEVATLQAIDGKTWNHPVVVGDRLYIRNGEMAACYRLPLATETSP